MLATQGTQMHEQEVKIQSGEITLTGTFCAPNANGEFPAVLMVHGSGPLDRDGNMKGQNLNIFSQLAHAFANRGIASLRYDKRGCGDSSGNFMTTGYSDLVQDAEKCLDALAESKTVSDNHLYILGHSEGCSIAPQISERRASVSGLVLLCPSIERVETLLVRQALQLEKEIDSLPGMSGYLYRTLFKIMGRPFRTQKRLIRKVRESDLPVVRHGVTRQPAKWLREILEMETERVFTSTHTPMLLVAGEKDLQSDPKER
ncbi:alpha/beta hydrolase [Marinagarivorans cellulosilyticus]|nr:alpha/beta fold hydrolase [Marinagarivorans cellulosilyticus]